MEAACSSEPSLLYLFTEAHSITPHRLVLARMRATEPLLIHPLGNFAVCWPNVYIFGY